MGLTCKKIRATNITNTFRSDWYYLINFRVIGLIKSFPPQTYPVIGVINFISAKMTFCKNRKFGQKKNLAAIDRIPAIPRQIFFRVIGAVAAHDSGVIATHGSGVIDTPV